MAKNSVRYSEIDWEKIDFSKITYVKDICVAIKEYYWINRPTGQMKSAIIESGSDYNFLIKAFETYHTEWSERTEGASKISFFVAIPKEQKYESSKCFHIVLDGVTPEDSAVSHGFKKIDKKRADIIKCCREAVRYDKQKVKKQYFNNLQKGENISQEDVHIHHSGIKFSEIVNNWIEENGGVEYLYQFVNTSIGNGTLTKFNNKEIANSFREYHNKFACLIPLSKEEHKELHSRK